MDSKEQQRRARKNCGKLYRKLLNDEDLIIDDEKFFKLSGNNVLGNRYFYSTDPSVAPPNIRFQQKTQFESKVMVWMAISTKGVSNVYVHRGKQAVDQKIYLKECINRRLLPFVDKYHSNRNILFWPDLARSHYSNIVQQRLNEKNIPYVSLVDNPPNVPQARPIEVIWAILERKIYENNWQANNIDHLVRRIKQKNQRIRSTNVARHDGRSLKKASAYMARWAISDLLNMFFCSTFHALSNRKKNIFVSIEMTTLCNSTFFQRLLHRLLVYNRKRIEITYN